MRLITYGGRTQNLAAWAKEIGIGRHALWSRLAMGWPLEQALSAGKRELYKGKPALAPLARKAGVSARAGALPEGGRPSNGKGFAARCFTASPDARSHLTARQRA